MRKLLLAVAIAAFSCGCGKGTLLRLGAKQGAPYFEREGYQGTSFEKIGERVYTYRWNWYRNIAIDTDEGWVVIDPFNAEAAKAQAEYLAKTKPGKPVRLLLYSHYHLDHVAGGAALQPREVIAHEYCQRYWDAAAKIGTKAVAEVLPPTGTISGDQTLTVGGVEIRLIDLGKSHSDHVYAFHLPSERMLFTADTGLVKTVPPLGIPDSYHPGVIEGMEKLAAIDFDVFVPSHFGTGKKQDLVDYIAYLKYQRQVVREAVETIGPATDKKRIAAYFDYAYPKLHAKYGDWHGFDEMFLYGLFREGSGELRGY